ncbi:ribonuclease D [Pseudoxanthomonas kalamensis DSM 18571]|uniref:ribonuclease D n=1 Tax=Pseudoxanthomonas kalamensis TaxID=289483 RepID=UPI001390C308|nr:ribonuclease D [Pseudoxanthomonas kalamensis]KAF1710394.1 ribonuclease D [Pseudoxanthomonas kalamensis DSM 18571]
MPRWIDSPQSLSERLQNPPAWIGLDTEFVRERTYWPQLALVQMAIGEEILLIDPLVPDMAQALAPILNDPAVLKVMHSASEDLVALGHACDALPAPLFDTQIAAALCGMGAGMGYQKLVLEIADRELPKGETRSDWMRRPLSEAQLQYAADDVEYLGALYADLQRRLDAAGRSDWLRQDCSRLLAQAGDAQGETWPHLSLRSAQFLEPDAQHRLLRLLRWRELQARRSDRPRSWILDNELSAALARDPPASREALQSLLDSQPKAPRKLGDALWQALTTPLADESQAPLARAADNADKARLKRLQQAVAERSAELGLPDGVLASRRWLEALMDGDGRWPPALEGWRREQLESRLAPLLEPPLASAPASG